MWEREGEGCSRIREKKIVWVTNGGEIRAPKYPILPPLFLFICQSQLCLQSPLQFLGSLPSLPSQVVVPPSLLPLIQKEAFPRSENLCNHRPEVEHLSEEGDRGSAELATFFRWLIASSSRDWLLQPLLDLLPSSPTSLDGGSFFGGS